MHNIKRALIESRWVFFVPASLLQLFILKRVCSYAVKDTWDFLMFFIYDYHQPIVRVVVDVTGMWLHRMTNIVLGNFWIITATNLYTAIGVAGFIISNPFKGGKADG